MAPAAASIKSRPERDALSDALQKTSDRRDLPGFAAEARVLEDVIAIGTRLFGMPVMLCEGEVSHAIEANTFPPGLLRFMHDQALTGSDGSVLGSLSLVDLKSHPALDADQLTALDALGNVTGAYLGARRAIGEFDHVTLLPNRHRLLSDAARVSSQKDGDATSQSILLVTLADARTFNEILRALGHSYADEFLKAGVAVLRDAIPKDLDLYNVSVLSFAILLPSDPATEERIARNIVAAFQKPLLCSGVPLATRPGVGIATIGIAPGSIAESLRAALTAAQDGRQRSEGWGRYSKTTDEAHRRAFRLLSDFGTALVSKDQLTLHFQPRVSMQNGLCVGAEALLRWNHPQFGAISPGEFLPLVETTALIGPLTQWVFQHGIRQISQWKSEKMALSLALNVSPNNLREFGFADELGVLLAREGVDPKQIELEFTEGALTTNEPQVNAEIDTIRRMGIDIAIDDFGTGYSNMSYLTRLPVQIIKIDQSFVRTMGEQPRQQLLVRSITEMAHALGFRVVAEGIETIDAFRMLRSWDCDEGQGYLMSRPLEASIFQDWMADRTRSSAFC